MDQFVIECGMGRDCKYAGIDIAGKERWMPNQRDATRFESLHHAQAYAKRITDRPGPIFVAQLLPSEV